MRLCRFNNDRLGVVQGSMVRDVTAALDALPSFRYPLPCHDVLIANLSVVTQRIKEIAAVSPAMAVADVKLFSPVANPGKLVAAPVNYQKHLDEVKADSALHRNNPAHTITIHSAGLFLKASSSLIGPGEGIAIRLPDRRTDHEVELAVVIGRRASKVSASEALTYVAGYCIGLDITIRGSEDRSFRKSADTYSVLGPWLVTRDEIADPNSLDFHIAVNGEERQKSNTRYLILNVAQLIELASSFYTLHPGDIIYTGTPEGVSPIQAGDHIVATIEGIGTMEVDVRVPNISDAAAELSSAKVALH